VHEAADGMTTADIVHAPSTITVVIRGLDPRIHRASQEAFREDDGLPGQARQRRMIVDLDAMADFDPYSTFSSA
jgi:hypothetical protein